MNKIYQFDYISPHNWCSFCNKNYLLIIRLPRETLLYGKVTILLILCILFYILTHIFPIFMTLIIGYFLYFSFFQQQIYFNFFLKHWVSSCRHLILRKQYITRYRWASLYSTRQIQSTPFSVQKSVFDQFLGLQRAFWVLKCAYWDPKGYHSFLDNCYWQINTNLALCSYNYSPTPRTWSPTPGRTLATGGRRGRRSCSVG